MVWHMWIPAIVGLVGVIVAPVVRTFDNDIDYYIKADEVRRTEISHFKEALQ